MPIPHHALDLYDDSPLPVDNLRHRLAAAGMLAVVGGM